MERNKIIGLGIIIIGVAGALGYYFYTSKKNDKKDTSSPSPSTNLGRETVRNVAERFSMPIQSRGIAGRTRMGAVQMTSLVSGGASNAPSGTPSSSGGGRYDVFTSPQATSNLR